MASHLSFSEQENLRRGTISKATTLNTAIQEVVAAAQDKRQSGTKPRKKKTKKISDALIFKNKPKVRIPSGTEGFHGRQAAYHKQEASKHMASALHHARRKVEVNQPEEAKAHHHLEGEHRRASGLHMQEHFRHLRMLRKGVRKIPKRKQVL